MIRSFFFSSAVFFYSLISTAEVITCNGTVPQKTDLKYELTVDTTRAKSMITYIDESSAFPSSVTQGLSLHSDRYYISSKSLRYQNKDDSDDYLELNIENGKVTTATLNQRPYFEKSSVSCEVSGNLPLSNKCDSNPNQSLLELAKSGGSIRDLQAQISCGANINFKDKKGCTALLYSVDMSCGTTGSPMVGAPGTGTINNSAIVDFLISSGAFVDTVDLLSKETSLIKSAKYGVRDVYESFIAAEANFDAQDKDGYTALMRAAMTGDPVIVSSVLEGNPDRRIKNHQRQTAYDLAQHWGKNDVVDLLRIPDSTIVIEGKNDGTCSPLKIELKQNSVVEIVLKASDKMSLLKSASLGIFLMADPKSTGKIILSASNPGVFPFTCGFHGANSVSNGQIIVK